MPRLSLKYLSLTSYSLVLLATSLFLKKTSVQAQTQLDTPQTQTSSLQTSTTAAFCASLGVNTATPFAAGQSGGPGSIVESLVVNPNDIQGAINTINSGQPTIVRLWDAADGYEAANIARQISDATGGQDFVFTFLNEPNCDEPRQLSEVVTLFEQMLSQNLPENITITTPQINNSADPRQCEQTYSLPPGYLAPAATWIETLVSLDPSRVRPATAVYTVPGFDINQAMDSLEAALRPTLDRYGNNIPVFLTEVGALAGDFNQATSGNPLGLAQLLARLAQSNLNIAAALVFNGLCQNPDPTFNYTQAYCQPQCLQTIFAGVCSGTTPTLDQLSQSCIGAAGIQRDPNFIYVHPFNLDELARDYPVTCATGPNTFAEISGDREICNSLVNCVRNLEDTITHHLPQWVPWFSSEPEVNTQQISDRNNSLQQWFDYSAPENLQAPPEASAPFWKITNLEDQFKAKMAYLRYVDSLCDSPHLTVKEHFICIKSLPRLLSNGLTEIEFASTWPDRFPTLKSLEKGLSQADLDIFWNEIGLQVPPGKEFKVAFWCNFVEDPKIKFSAPILSLNNLFELFQKTPFKCQPWLAPVTAGIEYESADTGKFQNTAKLTLDSLTSTTNQESYADYLERIRTSRFAGTNSPGALQGPIIPCSDYPKVINDPIAKTLCAHINTSSLSCEGKEVDYAEPVKNSPPRVSSRLSLQGAPANIIKDILHGLLGSEIAQTVDTQIDPERQEQPVAISHSWVIQPGELENINWTGQWSTQNLTSQTAQERLFSSPDQTDFYRFSSGNRSANQPEAEPAVWQLFNNLHQAIQTKVVNIQLRTQNLALKGLLLGQKLGGFIKAISGDQVRNTTDPASFSNSGCQNPENQLECYLHENWTGELETLPSPQSPTQPGDICYQDLGDTSGNRRSTATIGPPTNPTTITAGSHPLVNYCLDMRLRTAFSTQAIIDQLKNIPQRTFNGQSIDQFIANYFGGANDNKFLEPCFGYQYCYEYIIDQAVAAGWNPALVLALWIEESGASACQRWLDIAGEPAHDFGCTAAERNNLQDGLRCLLNLGAPPYYDGTNYYNGTNFDQFLSRYSTNFETPEFPSKLLFWYQTLVGSGQGLGYCPLNP